MEIVELEKYNNEVAELANLDDYFYENIFKMYTADDKFAFNIIKTVNISEDIDGRLFDLVRVTGRQSWPQISFKVYGNTHLWWLICVSNKIMNPVINPKSGLVLRIVKPKYVESIITQIKLQLN